MNYAKLVRLADYGILGAIKMVEELGDCPSGTTVPDGDLMKEVEWRLPMEERRVRGNAATKALFNDMMRIPAEQAEQRVKDAARLCIAVDLDCGPGVFRMLGIDGYKDKDRRDEKVREQVKRLLDNYATGCKFAASCDASTRANDSVKAGLHKLNLFDMLYKGRIVRKRKVWLEKTYLD